MKISDLKIVVVSEVNERDGIGIEVYFKNSLIIEIFRDDSEKTKTVTSYEKSVPLEIIEFAIEKFNSEIPKEFID